MTIEVNISKAHDVELNIASVYVLSIIKILRVELERMTECWVLKLRSKNRKKDVLMVLERGKTGRV